MKREPSIHISESRLIEILDEVTEICQDDPQTYAHTPTVVKMILERAKKYQLSTRKLLASSKKITQKANVIAKSPLEDAMLMARIIYQYRKNLKHKGIEIAKPGTRDFTIIKAITGHALDYYSEFGGKREKPIIFLNYIELYFTIIGKNGKFNLITLQNSYNAIVNYKHAKILIDSDPNKEYTRKAYESYNHHVVTQIGELLIDYKTIPDKYKYFVEVAIECVKLKIEPVFWIKAQFKGLAWTNGIPEPNQLIGPKALERMQKYLFEYSQEPETKKEPSKQNIKSLKNLKKLK